jgi:hypothetical protein
MQQLPTTLGIMTVEETELVIDWLIARREQLLKFLYDNRLEIEYEAWYVQMFLNELVRRFLPVNVAEMWHPA